MNLFVVREVNDAFNTVTLLTKMGVNSSSFPITTFITKKIPNYKQKYDFVIITSSKSIKIFIRYLNFSVYENHITKVLFDKLMFPWELAW